MSFDVIDLKFGRRPTEPPRCERCKNVGYITGRFPIPGVVGFTAGWIWCPDCRGVDRQQAEKEG